MSLLRIEFPILITLVGGREYIVKPLFLDEPVYSNRRYREAIDGFRESVLRMFRRSPKHPIGPEKLRWFLFNPDVRYEMVPLAFKMGQRLVDDRFLAVWYHLHDHIILLLPAFNNFSCALPGELSLDQLHSHVGATVQSLFRRFREDGEDVQPSRYASEKGHTVAVVTIDVEYHEPEINLAPEEENPFFALFSRRRVFKGFEELEKTGRVVNDRFPHNLQTAYRREGMVAQVDGVVFGETVIPLVVLGAQGVGRTSVLHQAIGAYLQRCSADEKAKPRTVWHVDPQRVISGMSVVGEWQRRFEAMLDHLAEKDHVMFIDDVVPLFRIGKSSQNTLTLVDVLKPYLENRSVRVVLEATPGEWERVQEADRRFADLFRVIRIAEPQHQDLGSIFVRTRQALETQYEMQFEIEGLDFLWKWSPALLSHGALPGSLVAMMTQLAVRFRGEEVNVSKILQMIADRGVALGVALAPAAERHVDSTGTVIARRLIGQADAVSALVDVIEMVRARLGSGEKPEASLLFAGPTGVGKTYAAGLLAETLYGSKEQLLRFDMNEYVDGDAAGRLIGDSRHPEGLLTSALRLHPHAVVLFDEIEKAHSSIHDILLQVLGEARLTDVVGRTSDFTHAVIILTTNLGARQAGRELGFERGEEVVEETYRAAIRQFFRPEFTNRIDRLVVFHRLLPQDIRGIAALELDRFFQRDGLVRRNVFVSPSQSALECLARDGYDQALGARAMKRHIEAALAQTIAEQVVIIDTREPVLIQLHDPGTGIAVHIERLKPVEGIPSYRVPSVPPMDGRRSFLEKLLTEMRNVEEIVAERIEEAVLSAGRNEVNPHRDALYVFRESVRTHVVNLVQCIEEIEYQKGGKAAPLSYRFRVRRPGIFSARYRTGWLNIFSQLEIKDYLDDLYEQSANVIPVNDQFFVGQYLQTAFLRFLSQGLHAFPWPRIAVELIQLAPAKPLGLEVLIRETHESTIDRDLVDVAPAPIGPGLPGNVVIFSGPRIDELFQGESGIVLGYKRNESPEAVQVRVHRIAPQESIEEAVRQLPPRDELLRVPEFLRIYTSDREEESYHVTDFRSGFIGESEIQSTWVPPGESRYEERQKSAQMQSRLLVFAGLPAVDWLALPEEP